MKRLLYQLTCFLILMWVSAPADVFAQAPAKVIVRGKVTDAKDKTSIPMASVVELDNDRRVITGVQTDIDGNFALRVTDARNRIQVSYIGYKAFLAPISGRTLINVALTPIANELNQVNIVAQQPVNNGTGMNIDKRNLTTATETLNAKMLEELSSTSIDQALQGRLAGVDITTQSGDPGAPMSIRIRGTSAINGSANPMIVMDGLPYNIEIPSDFSFASADEQGYAQLLNIAPSDIKEITVLKDAAATAVWGSRAANGVLIITTKRGVMGRPVFSYNFRGTRAKQPGPLPMLNGDQYSQLIPEAISNRNGLPINTLANPEFNYDKRDPDNYYNYSNNTNWLSQITQVGFIQDHNMNMQGGGEKAKYYASLGYTNQRGTTVGTSLNRITSKINLDFTVSNRIRFRSDIAYTHVVTNFNYEPGSSSQAVRSVAYNKMPNMAVYQYDEYGNPTPSFFSPAGNIQGLYPGTYNPLALAMAAQSKQTGERILPHFFLSYDIIPTVLQATFDLGFDINNVKSQAFLPQIASGRPASETVVNRAQDNDGDTYDVESKFNLSFTPRFKSENHSLTSLLSVQTSDIRNQGLNIITGNSASSALEDAATPSRIQGGDFVLANSNNQLRLLGVALVNQYSLLDRYIINVVGRMDGNSVFSPKQRYGFFPGISARWRISGESFIQKVKKINDLSLRLSYGASGTLPNLNSTPGGRYLSYNTYIPTASSYAGESAVQPGNIGLENLKWQTTWDRGLGFDLVMFNNRLSVTADVYNRKTEDLFFNGLRIPAYTGYTTITANAGTLVNRGLEFRFNVVPYRSDKLQVGFDFNIAKNENVMTSVSDQFPRSDGRRVDQNGLYRTYLQVGNPFGSFYGFRYQGVYTNRDATVATGISGNPIVTPDGQTVFMRFNYPATDYTFQAGDAKYEDINHDGNINADDIVYLGNGTPKVTGGFGPSVTINKVLNVKAYFVYKLGHQLINQNLMTTTNMYGYNNQSTIVMRRWRNPGDVTDVPRALQGMGYNWLGSDRYVSDASFCRLQSVVVRYTLAKRLLDKLRFRTASIFLTAENLYTWTKYMGVDPDVSTRGDNNPFSYAQDDSLTPVSRNLVLGLTLGF